MASGLAHDNDAEYDGRWNPEEGDMADQEETATVRWDHVLADGPETTFEAVGDHVIVEYPQHSWARLFVPEGGKVRVWPDGLVNIVDNNGRCTDAYSGVEAVHDNSWKEEVTSAGGA
jgi:hypothetical protein